MEANRQTLCLSMIVKNDAPVIARCLASVRPILDYWVIVDIGSTDGTQDAIRTAMADLPGELHERPWRDFAHNRNEALELAQSHGEYMLIVDADDVLEFEPKFDHGCPLSARRYLPVLQADSYMLRIAEGSTISHNGTQIVRAALPWRWRGVLYGFLTCDDARSNGVLEGLLLRRRHDGARRQDDPETWRRDAEILYAALQTESDPYMQARYRFYLAQSYRDCGEKEKALKAYLKRAELGFWVEEVYLSLYYAAQLQEALGRPFDEAMATYRRAANAAPSRAEAVHGASRYCRLRERYKEGYEIAKRTYLSAEVPDGPFVEPWIYEYGLFDELAINAYWAGAYQDSLDACERILRERKCPEAERPRIEANAAFARRQLSATSYGYFDPYNAGEDSYILLRSNGDVAGRHDDRGGRGLPVPPAGFWGGSYDGKIEEFLKWGKVDVDTMWQILESSGFRIGTGGRVLDFGCSSGRMIRWLADIAGRCEVWGADISAPHIIWCQEHISPPFNFATVTTAPHLPFEDGYFDLIYCGSVFTHISDLADAWLLELKRIVRPEGRLYITIHDNHTVDQLINLPERWGGVGSWFRNLLLSSDRQLNFTKQEFHMFTINRGPNSQVFYDITYLRQHWGRYLNVLSVTPEAYGYQTAIVLEKPSPRP